MHQSSPPKSPAGGLHENHDLTSPHAGDLGGEIQNLQFHLRFVRLTEHG